MSQASPKLKIFLSESLNPHLNLATEEWIFHKLDPADQVLFLWRNDNTVVIGRNQNPWTECNLTRMKEDQVTLARRTTGGGAVFHDLGNTNFTFLSPREGYRRENNYRVILDALQTFGIAGEISGRNDLTVNAVDGPRKFSGSAYREKRDRAFHHGTLLLHADLAKLGNYLTPNPKKMQSKGKTSVRARVMNLNEIVPELRHDAVVAAMVKSFEKFYGVTAEVEMLSMESLRNNDELKEQFEILSSWAWLYGHTMEFSHQMDEYLSLGFFDFQFKVDEGVVTQLQIFSDSLYPDFIAALTSAFEGRPYQISTVRMITDHLKTEFPDLALGIDELQGWLAKQIEI